MFDADKLKQIEDECNLLLFENTPFKTYSKESKLARTILRIINGDETNETKI